LYLFFMIFIRDVSKKNQTHFRTIGDAGRFPSCRGWFYSFQPPLGEHKQQNSEKNAHKISALGPPPPLLAKTAQGRLEFDDVRLVSALARRDHGRLS
jgi:hypothetical protein